jgi:hypothetical protein
MYQTVNEFSTLWRGEERRGVEMRGEEGDAKPPIDVNVVQRSRSNLH